MPKNQPDASDAEDPSEEYLDDEHEPARFWTRGEVMKFLGVDRSKVRRLEESGQLTSIFKDNKHWFDPEQVRAYATSQAPQDKLPPTSAVGTRTTEVAQRRDAQTGFVETQRRVTEAVPGPNPMAEMLRASTELSSVLIRHLESRETKSHQLVDLSMQTLVQTNQQLRNEVLKKDEMIEKLVSEKFSNLEVVESLLTQKHQRDLDKFQVEAHENRLDTSLAVFKVLAPGLVVYATAKTPEEKEAARQSLFSALGNATGGVGNGLAAKAASRPHDVGSNGVHGTSMATVDPVASRTAAVKAAVVEGIAQNADRVAADMLFEATPPGQLDTLAQFLSPEQAAALNQLFENYLARYPDRKPPKTEA